MVEVHGQDDPRNSPSRVSLIECGADLFEVRLVRVIANTEVPDDWVESEANEEEVRSRLVAESENLTRDFCNWVRVRGRQTWWPPPGERPNLVSTAELLVVTGETTARSLGTLAAPGLRFRVVPPEFVVGENALRAIEGHLQQGAPEPAELLLADAFYALQTGGDTDPAKAVLLAAIAVETRTRQVVRELANDSQVTLVELLTDNPRDWSLSAHAMFAKAVPATLGRTPSPDWSDAAKLVQGLFEARNRVAHKGEAIDHATAAVHVSSARTALDLLTAIEPSAMTSGNQAT